MTGHFAPKRVVTFLRNNWTLSPDVHNWSVELTNWAYYGFLQGFLDPQAQIASLGLGLALAYLVGSIHVTTV